jgi:hypothetical protein
MSREQTDRETERSEIEPKRAGEHLSRRRYLALSVAATAGLAGCSGGSGNGNGDDGDGGSTDPFDSVEIGPQTLTAAVASSAIDEGAEVVALVGDGETVVEEDIERGTGELGLSVVGDCGSCPEFNVKVPDGEYTLEARALPEDDNAEATTVGSRAVTVERSAEITAIEDTGEEMAMTVENTGDLLIWVRGIRREAADSGSPDAPEDWYTETRESVRFVERTDNPDHELRKTENRRVLERIIVPGSDGVFSFPKPPLYRSEGMTSEDACTGQSVGLRFEVLGHDDSPVRAAATGELTFAGGVTSEVTVEQESDGFACSGLTVENLTNTDS